MKKGLLIFLLLLSIRSLGQGGFGADGALHPTGSYPIVVNNEVKGGIHRVKDLTARDLMPANYRDTGMLCYVTSNSTYYQLIGGLSNSNWLAFTSSGGNTYTNGFGLMLDLGTNTFSVDTTLIATRAWLQKGIDSLGAITMKYSDTLSILRNFVTHVIKDSINNIYSQYLKDSVTNNINNYIRDSISNIYSYYLKDSVFNNIEKYFMDSLTNNIDRYLKDSITKIYDHYLKDSVTNNINTFLKDSIASIYEHYLKDSVTNSIDRYLKDSITKIYDHYLKDSVTNNINTFLKDSIASIYEHYLKDSVTNNIDRYLRDSISKIYDHYLKDSVTNSIDHYLKDSIATIYDHYLKDSVINNIDKYFRDSISNSIDHYFRDSISKIYDHYLKDSVINNIDKYFKDSITNSINHYFRDSITTIYDHYLKDSVINNIDKYFKDSITNSINHYFRDSITTIYDHYLKDSVINSIDHYFHDSITNNIDRYMRDSILTVYDHYLKDSITSNIEKYFHDSISNHIDHYIRDSINNLINANFKGDTLTTQGPIKIISGTGDGATLKPLQLGLDVNALGHMLTQNPLNDSLAMAVTTSPVRDSIKNIINNQIAGKVNYSDSGTVFTSPTNLKDTAAAIRAVLSSLKHGVDTVYSSSDTIYWSKNGSTFYSIIDTFKTNITAHLQSGYTFGKYANGQTIPSQGKSASQVIIDALTQAIPPTYSPPTAGISGSPVNGTYEYGYNLGTITLSSSFTQNDAGSLNATTYYANGSSLGGGNSFSVASLTTQQSAYVNKAYNQGACKNNNLGTQDCSGQINAGNTNSGSINWIPGYRRYYGWINDTTGITTGGQNAAILALVDNSQFSVSQVFGSASSPVNTGNPSGTQFFVFGYLSASPAITAISQNGIPSFSAYNTAVLSSFTNSQNATVSIRIYYNKNGQTTSSIIYTN